MARRTDGVAERAALLTEWLQHLHDAIRFGSERPHEIADVLTFGTVGPPFGVGFLLGLDARC